MMNQFPSSQRRRWYFYFFLIIITSLLLVVSCSTRSKKEKELLTKWKTEARNLLKQQHLLYWFHGVQGMRMRLAESYANHQELLSPPTIQFVMDAMNEARTPAQAQELRFLKNFLIQKYLKMRIATLDDSMRFLYQNATIRMGRRTMYFRDVPFYFIKEKNTRQRKNLFQKTETIRKQFAQLTAYKYQQIAQLVQQLGYPNYNEFIAEIYEIHPHDLYRLSQEILDSTAQEYQHLTSELQTLYHWSRQPEPQDIPLLRSGKYFDLYIQPIQLETQQHLLLRSLGIDPRRQTGLTQDFNATPEKMYYRLMLAVDIPVDIRLSLKPHHHFEDLWQLFYLTGQAEHYLNTEISSWINQQLGSPAMRKVYGYLFASIWNNPNWLRHALPIPGKDSLHYQQYIRWYQLDQIRYFATLFKLGYELELGTTQSPEIPLAATTKMYANALPDFGLDVIHAEFDPYLNAALELEAIVISSQLLNYITQNYGSNWFENPESGKFLKSLWWRGNEITIQYILKKIGQPHLTAGYLYSHSPSPSAH